MLQHARDVLRVAPKTPETEIEFRFAVHASFFDIAHGHWISWWANTVDPTHSVVLCNNDSDLRCVDGKWERKRIVDRLKVPVAGRLRAVMGVSVESSAIAPDDTTGWNIERRRKRWTYSFPGWDVSWTLTRQTEIEIEFTGDIRELIDSKDLCKLERPLSIVIACLAFEVDNRSYLTRGERVPYVRATKNKRSCGVDMLRYMQRAMRTQQPVSLRHHRSIHRGEICVSLKYDGTRAMLFVTRKHGVPVCWMLMRDRMMYSVPCLDCDTPMIIDGELMGDKFVAFDILHLDGRNLNNLPFQRRIHVLQEQDMPTMLPFVITVKQFYPLNYPAEFADAANADDVDGVILHVMNATVFDNRSMYKWKKSHTLDVHIRDNKAYAEDGILELSVSREVTDGLWECRICSDSLVPVKVRTDKSTANALHVCNEIIDAHKSNIDLSDVPGIFSK